jgi:hypothetical protein
MIFRVTDLATGKPVSDAEIHLPYLDPPQDYRTDQEGVCHILLPEELGEHLGVFARKAGFVPVRVAWKLDWRSAPLPADYTLALEPATSVGGRVHDESGAPIEGATVYLMIWAVSGDGKVTTDILDETAITDAEGVWHFDEAPADLEGLSYRLKHPDYVEDLNFTTPRIPAGILRDRTVVWVMKKGVPARGMVIDDQDRPIANAEILPGKSRVCSGEMPSFRTDAAGRFSLLLSPGDRASLTIKAEGHAPALLEFEVSDDLPPLRVVMEPGFTLRGRVVDRAGAPIEGAHVFADTWRRHRTLEWMTRTDAEGRFSWDCAPPDEVLFDFLQTGYQPARRTPLTASEEEHIIVLRKPLWLRGAVTDAATGKPIKAFRVITGHIQGNRRIHWMRNRAVDFTGGSYERPFSPDGIAGAVWFLRVEAEGYRSGVSEIHDSGEVATLDFPLEPGTATTGLALKPDGTPAENAAVVVVFGNSAMLLEGVLRAGHGNMELSASSEGTFSFPPQEPPYAIVVAHATGCAIATAEEFAAEPVLHLQPWGRLEITSDGAAPAGEAIPFHIHYADLPTDARRIPWVSIHAEPKRISENRIVFEKLLPGRASLGRFGQPNDQALTILIEGSKTITLDFDRGIAPGGRVRGTEAVKVIDESGNPVPGAAVTPMRFKLKSARGSTRTSAATISPPPAILTNAHGVAMVGYPLAREKDREVQAVYLVVRHPDFCPAHAEAPVAGEALPIVLRRGANVTVSGFFEAYGRAAAQVHAQADSPDRGGEVDPDTWTAREEGAVGNTQFPPGKKFVRLACFPEAGPAHFSEIVEVNVEAGQVIELRMALKPGERFAGRLDETVPRPVMNGRVDAHVYTDAEGLDKPMQWRASARVEADGSFVFESLPGGRIELIALCDGHASKNSPTREAHSMRTPQAFQREPGGAPVVVAMEATATLRLVVGDEKGRPLAVGRAHANPNVVWGDRSGGIFGMAFPGTEELLCTDAETRRKRFQTARLEMHPYHGDTDLEGTVTIANLPAGKQHFAVFCQGYEMELLAPGGMMPGFREIDLRAGEVRTIALTMHKKEPA